jgi:predicted O-methyltransferase YrrM
MPSPDASLAILEKKDLTDDRLELSMDPRAYAVLDGIWMDRSDPHNPVPLRGGHLSRGKAVILHNLVSAIRPANSIEIGLFRGVSAITIMAAARRDGYRGHVAMDPVQKTHAESAGLKNIETAGLSPFLSFLEAESCVGLPYIMLNKAMTFDFAFIDASHHFDHTLLEFFYIDRLIPTGSIIAFDDVSTPAVEAVINYIAVNRHYACRKIGGLVCCVKMADDVRYWYEFNRFEVPATDAFLSKKQAESGKPPRLKQYT